MCLSILIEFGPKLTDRFLKIRISIFIWKKFVESPTGPKCRMAGITLKAISALRVIWWQNEKETMQKYKLKLGSALLSALLPPTGVSFYAKSVKFCVVQVYHFWGFWVISKVVSVVFWSLPDTLETFWDDPGHFLESLFFHDFWGFWHHIFTSSSNNDFEKMFMGTNQVC